MESLLRRCKFCVVVIGVLFLAACSSTNEPIRLYEGVKQPDSDVVKFIIPADLDILRLDEASFKDSPHISDGQYQLELLPGTHRFKIIYSRIWGSDALGNLVESNAFYFDVNALAGSTYVFKHNGPVDLLDADWSDVSDIRIWLEEQKTGRKIKAISVRAYDDIISRYILGDDEPEKRKVVLAKPKSAPGSQQQLRQKDSTSTEQDKVQQKAGEQLEFWWKIANAAQRKLFQDWLVTLKEPTLANSGDAMQQKALAQLKFWWKLADLKQRESFLLWIKK